MGSVEGSELVTNGDFATDSDWTKDTGWSITGGQAVCDGTQVSTASLDQNGIWNPIADGDLYILEITIVACSDFSTCGLYGGVGSLRNFSATYGITAPGTYRCIRQKQGDGNPFERFEIYASAGQTLTIDNVSLKPYTPTAAEQWSFANMTNGIGKQTTDSALVTTLYDQAASNEQVFDDPTMQSTNWSFNRPEGSAGGGSLTMTKANPGTANIAGTCNIANYGGSFRVEIDYTTTGDADAEWLFYINDISNQLDFPLGSGTLTANLYEAPVANKVIIRSYNIAPAGATITVTGIRLIDLGNPATQSTAAAQPKLITAGVTELENGKPAMVFDGVDDELTVSYSPSDYPITQTVVARGDAANTGYALSLHLSGQADEYLTGSPVDASAVAIYSARTTGASANPSNAIIANDYTLVFSYSSSSTSHSTHLNGGAAATSATSVTFPAPDTIAIGNLRNNSPLYFAGKIQEAIVYASDQSANRTILETNINDHYGIY